MSEQFIARPLTKCTQQIEDVWGDAVDELNRQKNNLPKSLFYFKDKKKLEIAIDQLNKLSIKSEMGNYLDEIRFMKPVLEVVRIAEEVSPYFLGLNDRLKKISSLLYFHAAIEIELDTLRREAIDLDHRGYRNKANILRNLLISLEDQKIFYFKAQAICYLSFKENCLRLIEETKPVLRIHQRGMDILDHVLGLLYMFIAALAFHDRKVDKKDEDYRNNHYYFFKPRTLQQLESLEQAVTIFAPPQPKYTYWNA